MPWKEIDVVDQRTEFALRVLRNVESFGDLCREFGISRRPDYERIKPIYRWAWRLVNQNDCC